MNGTLTGRLPFLRSPAAARLIPAVLIPAWMFWSPHGAYADSAPVAGKLDARIRTAVYDAREVYRIEARIGYQIDLEFEPDERFTGLAAGDLRALSFEAQGNHLFLKPKAAHVRTNLTVLTDRHVYHFDYSVALRDPDTRDPDVREPAAPADVIYAVRFSYPGAASAAQDAADSEIDKLLEPGTTKAPANLDYWYCGAPGLKPVRASDDGVHTRLTFGGRAELPAIFVRNDDGSESLLNFNVQAGDVIIHRVARRFIVRRGKLTGCIVNAAYSGSGSRAASGTVSPSVERATRRVRP